MGGTWFIRLRYMTSLWQSFGRKDWLFVICIWCLIYKKIFDGMKIFSLLANELGCRGIDFHLFFAYDLILCTGESISFDIVDSLSYEIWKSTENCNFDRYFVEFYQSTKCYNQHLNEMIEKKRNERIYLRVHWFDVLIWLSSIDDPTKQSARGTTGWELSSKMLWVHMKTAKSYFVLYVNVFIFVYHRFLS